MVPKEVTQRLQKGHDRFQGHHDLFRRSSCRARARSRDEETSGSEPTAGEPSPPVPPGEGPPCASCAASCVRGRAIVEASPPPGSMRIGPSNCSQEGVLGGHHGLEMGGFQLAHRFEFNGLNPNKRAVLLGLPAQLLFCCHGSSGMGCWDVVGHLNLYTTQIRVLAGVSLVGCCPLEQETYGRWGGRDVSGVLFGPPEHSSEEGKKEEEEGKKRKEKLLL